jgi:hypothetical protein
MTWEILRRGSWQLILATMAATALPTMILMALRHDGFVDPQDRSMLIMHIVVVNNTMLVIGAALFSAQGRISRLYAYPLRTSSIVAWRLLPAMAIMAALTAGCTAILNLIFDLGWPVWGPALVAGVAMASVNALVWLTEKSPVWLAVAMAAVGGVIGFWFKSRYGSAFSEPTRFWYLVTPADAFTMLAMSVFAYWIAVKAVARNRRGDPPLSLGWLAWLDRIFDRSTPFGEHVNSPFRAQCWFHWQRKGWLTSAGVLFTLLMGLIIWIFSDRQPENLVQGFFGGGAMLAFFGFIAGIVFGNTGPNDADYVMGHFLATRPISDTDAARAILLTAAKSVLLAWAIWALAFALACCCIAASGYSAAIKFPENIGWWYFPATLLGPWMVASTLIYLGLLGSTKYVLQFLCGVAGAALIMAISSKFLLKPAAQWLLEQAFFAFVGSGLIIAGGLAFVIARRRRLIQSPTVWIAAFVWIASTIALATLWRTHADPRLIGYLLIAACAALLVAPIAAAPLALSINRHR